MPLYLYRCPEGHEQEELQSFDAAAPACAVCGQATERVLSAPTLRFHGSGFYATDYAKPTTE